MCQHGFLWSLRALAQTLDLSKITKYDSFHIIQAQRVRLDRIQSFRAFRCRNNARLCPMYKKRHCNMIVQNGICTHVLTALECGTYPFPSATVQWHVTENQSQTISEVSLTKGRHMTVAEASDSKVNHPRTQSSPPSRLGTYSDTVLG